MNQVQLKSKRASQLPGTTFGIAPLDVIEDILIGLAKDNENTLEQLSGHAGSFKQPKVIELIFLLSEHWGQDNSTKYQAVELLDRFMILRVEELYKSSAEGLRVKESSEVKSWASIKASLCDVFMLHLASCVQITSKLHCHNNIINNHMVLQFLRSAGYSYTKEDPLRSELTVLKTLNFRINIHSPYAYVEMLLEVLGQEWIPEVRFMAYPVKDDITHTAKQQSFETFNGCAVLQMLDVGIVDDRQPKTIQLCCSGIDKGGYPGYISAEQDYQLDMCRVTNSVHIKYLSKFLAVKEDQMLLGTGVIAASTFIINKDCWNQVLEHLSNITGITVKSVFDMCSAVLKQCVGDSALFTH